MRQSAEAWQVQMRHELEAMMRMSEGSTKQEALALYLKKLPSFVDSINSLVSLI